MPDVLNALLDRPILLALLLGIGAAIGIAVERFAESQKRAERRAYWAGRNAGKGGSPKPNMASRADGQAADTAAGQLKAVMEAKFTARPLLNRPEAAVFKALDTAVIARNPKWQVMAQVSLGEFLASPDKEAYFAVNAKRVDFALMDENAQVRHAMEYQGTGHHMAGGAAAARSR